MLFYYLFVYFILSFLEFCSLLREYAHRHCWRVAIAGPVINLRLTRTENREYISVNGKAAFFQFTDDVGTLAVSRCAGAEPSRALYDYVLTLKSLPKLLSFLR